MSLGTGSVLAVSDEHLARVVELYRSRGIIDDDVDGDLAMAARAWLDQAAQELAVLEPILNAGQFRVAYNTSYDIYRHAAEAADLAAGYRVLARPGAHAATFALASAILSDGTDAFDTVNATTMTGTRNRLEYLDASKTVEVTEDEARWAATLAIRAVAAVSAYVG